MHGYPLGLPIDEAEPPEGKRGSGWSLMGVVGQGRYLSISRAP
jgi:hypothetical protein